MINYVIKLKNSQNYNLIVKILLILFILSLFFPIRHVFLTKEAYLTGNYSDFTSFSLYLSDILLFLLALITFLPRGIKIWLKIKEFSFLSSSPYALAPIFWLIIGLILVFLVHFGLNIRLNAYLLIKWLELLVSYGTFKVLFEQNWLKNLFLKLFVWLCGLQSIIALAQFAKQSSLGLYKLGESHLAPNIQGVAKIVSGGTTFIRGYGTFSHPNPFSAFLVAGTLITTYLLIHSANKKLITLYSILLFLNILGLTVTFSRGAYLALAAGLILFFGLHLLWRHPERVQPSEGSHIKDSSASDVPQSGIPLCGTFGLRMRPVIVLLISIVVSFFLFKPFLLTRATFADQSTMDRKFYDITGVKMAAQNPFFGLGLGESLLHMEQYSGKSLAPWDKQPPHNYFILAAAELGIPAMLILIWIFFSHLWGLIKKIRHNKQSTNYYLLTTILCSFLLLMLFDHYFYDLNQTQLLLWVFLALMAAIASKNTNENNTQQI